MNAKPLVSIIVPVYNSEAFLEKCLHSICAQTLKDWECIAIDDGSTDTSGTILDTFAQHEPRMTVIHQKNSGVSASRNVGLQCARGDWIAFVDADDWIEPNMYETMYNRAIEQQCDVVVCAFFGQHFNRKIQNTHLFNSFQATQALFSIGGLGGFCWSKLIAKKRLEKLTFDTSIFYLEDMVFFYELFKICDRVYLEHEALYHYEIHESSVTQQRGLTVQAQTGLDALQTMLAKESNPSIQKAIRSFYLHFCISLYYGELKRDGGKTQAKDLLRKYIKKDFFFLLFFTHIPFKKKLFACAVRLGIV